ncbi:MULTISPECIES: sigma-70 family RNA polymerase sigma factor [Rhizobium]|uniref:RNA polymerase sigma-70 factor, ECF subfamily n=1 Tax=Rhizobium miluonense TaxID=411945 RepID=A0A1C3WXG6_9HYPH|nr:sigma-70 family RNA polymerase sigma factor [Rhizobium miluonense]SCB44424.1 RNA polymerase sigma-70 factor, ECF subfamily [Rhizobium miluonense]
MIANHSQPTSNEQLQTALRAYPKLLSVARRITGSMTLAEDVVQEVLLQLVSKPLRQDIAALPPYLMRMVRNLATDHMRRLRYERGLFVEEEVGGNASAYGSPEEHLHEAEAYKAFRCTVEAMPARTRKFYEEHYFDDVPQNVIAKEAGVSCALVCGLLREAHSRCLAALALEVDQNMTSSRNQRRDRSSRSREMRA